MTYPTSQIQELVAAFFVPVKVSLNRPRDRAHFRAYQVIWTPTVVIMDWRGTGHYHAVGYLPPDLFAAVLRIGLARAQMAWTRYEEAIEHLTTVAESPQSAIVPEALFWLGVARYLQTRRRAPMMDAWNRLRADYPSSIWAARIPPNQEDEA